MSGTDTTPVKDLPVFADLPAAGQSPGVGRLFLPFFARAHAPSACREQTRHAAVDRTAGCSA